MVLALLLLAVPGLDVPALAQEEPAEAEEQDAEATPDFPDYPGVVNPLEREKITAALAGLNERSRLVQALVLDTARTYRRAAQQRNDALESLSRVTHALDRAAVQPRDLSPERLEELLGEVETARQALAARETELGRLITELRGLIRERDALAVRIADLRSRLPEQEELLTGVWEVTWMPANVSGTFYLDQSGTLVTGQYRLGPLGAGSLQGTFVGGKLFLQRIDAERGRDAEIEGLLDPGGRRIRGTWQAYELVQGGLPQGQWVARRVQ
jgi:hypothetical protein